MTAAAPSGRRRARRALLVLLAAGLALELSLQTVAWRVWSMDWIGPDGPIVAGRVLVVGGDESFELGVLVRDDAWPGDVGRRLRAAGRNVDVRNRASPGRDSRDVLRRLPLQLTLERPEAVVLCVGRHDFGRRDATAVDESMLRGRNAPFEWRWRSRELVRGWFTDVEPGTRDRLAFLGVWHVGDSEFEFAEDGTFRMGSVAAAWRPAGDGLRVAIPGGEPFDVDWTVEGDRLDLRGGFPGGRLSLERGPGVGSAAARARRAMARGDGIEAELAVVPAVFGALHERDAVAELIELDLAFGRIDEARRLAATLPTEPRNPAAVRRVARALIAFGDRDAGVALIEDDLASHVVDEALVAALRGLPAGELGDRVAARAVAALASAAPPAQPALAWIAADLLARAGREAEALEAGIRGLTACRGELAALVAPAVLRGASDAQWLAATVDLPTMAREIVDRHRAALAVADAATAGALAANLRRAIALVRFHGAEPMLLDPADDPIASATRRRVAAELDTPIASCAADREALAAAMERLLSQG